MTLVRILIVDDFAEWCTFARSILRNEPSFDVVCEVSDGLKAVQSAEALRPTVVLLDIGLPRLNGIEAGGWIRKLSPESKIVFVSERYDPDVVKAALHLGSGYVLKSDAAGDLIAAIHAAVQGHKYVSKQLTRFRLKEPVD